MEAELGLKMKEFMTVQDQVKKYKEILLAFPDFLIIIAFSIIGYLSVDLIDKLELVFVSYINTGWIGSFSGLSIIFLLLGVIVGIYWVNRKVRSVQIGEWQSTLKEGAPGAIKLLQEQNWNKIFSDIRYAKLGFWVYGIAKTIAFWVLALVGFSIVAGFIVSTLHLSVDFLVVALLSMVFVLILNRKDLQRRFDQMGNLDALMWELRWFDGEFRRADFKT